MLKLKAEEFYKIINHHYIVSIYNKYPLTTVKLKLNNRQIKFLKENNSFLTCYNNKFSFKVLENFNLEDGVKELIINRKNKDESDLFDNKLPEFIELNNTEIGVNYNIKHDLHNIISKFIINIKGNKGEMEKKEVHRANNSFLDIIIGLERNLTIPDATIYNLEPSKKLEEYKTEVFSRENKIINPNELFEQLHTENDIEIGKFIDSVKKFKKFKKESSTRYYEKIDLFNLANLVADSFIDNRESLHNLKRQSRAEDSIRNILNEKKRTLFLLKKSQFNLKLFISKLSKCKVDKDFESHLIKSLDTFLTGFLEKSKSSAVDNIDLITIYKDHIMEIYSEKELKEEEITIEHIKELMLYDILKIINNFTMPLEFVKVIMRKSHQEYTKINSFLDYKKHISDKIAGIPNQ